jgi:hypothetical protein
MNYKRQNTKKPDWDRMHAFIAEQHRWASLFVRIDEIVKENKLLVRDLTKYDATIAVPLLSSLLTLPELQSNCLRIEVLVYLSIIHCKGRKRPNLENVMQWFALIGQSRCAIGEDPAEDLFVELVMDQQRDYRLIGGLWEGAGFYTQCVLDIVATMPDAMPFAQTKKNIHALLAISDLICQKSRLARYQLGSDDRHHKLSLSMLLERKILLSHVTITSIELTKIGISKDDLEPFILQPYMRNELFSQHIGNSHLELHPLIVVEENKIIVALPTAMSIAIRNHLISRVLNERMTKAFDEVLAGQYANLLSKTPILGRHLRAPVLWRWADQTQFAEFCVEVDKGYFISFHFFLPSIQIHRKGGFKEPFVDDGSIFNNLNKSIQSSISHFDKLSNFKQGLALVIGCGWGKGFASEGFENSNKNWLIQFITAADLIRLSWLNEMNPQYFWRIHNGLEVVEEAGVRIQNPNGLLNLIGWVRRNDGHFVPHAQLPESRITPEKPLMISIPLNLIRDVRAEAACSYDRHIATDNLGNVHCVQRVSPYPIFKSDGTNRLYASLEDLNKRKLTTVYEGKINLWITVSAPNISVGDAEYHLWEMANVWLHRIGAALEKRLGTLINIPNLKVYAEFLDSNPLPEKANCGTIEDFKPFCKVVVINGSNSCKAIFEPGFLAAFRIPENIAERLFVRTITQAYLHLLGEKNNAGDAEDIENMVVPNDNARSFHYFQAQQFIDYVLETLPARLVTIDSLDAAAAKIGLGWRASAKGENKKVIGKEACITFLNNTVEALLRELFDLLVGFERQTLLLRLARNCEKASTEENYWRRTSAAVLGLHKDKSDVEKQYFKQLSKFASAAGTSRIVIEIALCVCHKSGKIEISDIELSKLLAHVALIIHIGGLSDAIHYNALAPELTVSPLGDILLKNEFGEMVVEPMLARVMGDILIAEAPLQRRNYEEPKIGTAAKGKIDDEFWKIWNNEMGFTIDDGRCIIDALEDKGIKASTAVYIISRSEYLSIAQNKGVSANTAQNFLKQFSLSTRPTWDNLPKGFNLKEIYPWRFGRRLSYVVRPILVISEGGDPDLIIAPNALRKGFAYVIEGAYSGSFDQSFFRTTEMKDSWWGKASEGHTYNKKIAKELRGKGWNVRENIGLPELFNRKMDRNYGDVDVFAWRNEHKEVLVIECKDLSQARNYSEIAELLSEYQGIDSNGKPDKLKKHLNRMELIESNHEEILRFTRLWEIRIISCLACSGVVPMQYAKIDALKNTLVGSIQEILKNL